VPRRHHVHYSPIRKGLTRWAVCPRCSWASATYDAGTEVDRDGRVRVVKPEDIIALSLTPCGELHAGIAGAPHGGLTVRTLYWPHAACYQLRPGTPHGPVNHEDTTAFYRDHPRECALYLMDLLDPRAGDGVLPHRDVVTRACPALSRTSSLSPL